MKNHKPAKRRNIKRWMENRLRRIDAKIASYKVSVTKFSPFEDFSSESIERCRHRGSQLANALQIMLCDEMRRGRGH